MNDKKDEKPVEEKPIEEKVEKKEVEPPRRIGDQPKSMLQKMEKMEETLDRITELEEKGGKKKNFKIPGKVKRQTRNLSKLMKKNRIQVLILKLTGDLDTTIGEVSMGRIIVGEFYWNAADNFVWRWQGKTPTALLPEWDMQPLTQKRLMQDTDQLKTWLHPQTILLRAIAAKQALEQRKGMKLNPMMLIVLVVVALVFYYLFFGGS